MIVNAVRRTARLALGFLLVAGAAQAQCPIPADEFTPDPAFSSSFIRDFGASSAAEDATGRDTRSRMRAKARGIMSDMNRKHRGRCVEAWFREIDLTPGRAGRPRSQERYNPFILPP